MHADTQSLPCNYPLLTAPDVSPHAYSTQLVLEPYQLADLYQLAAGVYAPLSGFLDEHEYGAVCESMHLPTQAVWPVPITLAVSEDIAHHIRRSEKILLTDATGTAHGILTSTSIYRPDKFHEAQTVFRTTDARHPGVQRLLQSEPFYVGGPITVFRLPPSPFEGVSWLPEDVRTEIRRRGWQNIVGFQTRNPVHRAHEYIQKSALETVDGLLLHPLTGPTKADDVPPHVRMATYHTLIADSYPRNRVLLAVYTGAMRYAGPREAVLHALVRRNYGCTHFIVGRDHGGVGHFYGPYDAHHIFDQFGRDELGIMPLFFEDAFYCRQCRQMATAKTCPHTDAAHVSLSGSEVRRRLTGGEAIPSEFMHPKISEILRQHYQIHG